MLPMDETSPPTSDEERAARMPGSGDGSPQHDGVAADSLLQDGMLSLRRNLHPESSKQVLQTWLEENLEHPYPLEEKKMEFMEQTGLTMKQINYWFINARRRKVPSMREQQYYRQAAAARVSANHLGNDLLSCNPYMSRRDPLEVRDKHFQSARTHQFTTGMYNQPATGSTTMPSPTCPSYQHLTTTPSTVVSSTSSPVPGRLNHYPTSQQLQQQHQHQLQQHLNSLFHLSPTTQQPPLQLQHQQQQAHNQTQTAIWGQSGLSTSHPRAAPTEWTQLAHISPVAPSPPRTLAMTNTPSPMGLGSPINSYRSYPSCDVTAAAPVSPTRNDSSSGAVALSVRMPLLVQTHLHPIPQTPPAAAAAAGATATATMPVVQASTYMQWPVRMSPQVTLATTYPANHLVYTPVSSNTSTNASPFPQ